MTLTGPADLAQVLRTGGAPADLAGPVSETLGPDAPGLLANDPWRLLDVRAVRPEQADAFAREVLGGGSPGDPRRGAALVTWHLRRAAADGHTAVPEPLVRAALAGHGVTEPVAAVEAACDDGRVLSVEGQLAGAHLARAEDAVAEGLLRLEATAERLEIPPDEMADPLLETVATHGVVLVESPYEARLGPVAAALARLAAVRVVDRAELLDVPAAARLVQSLADGDRLVLAGDPQLLPPAGPGRVLVDGIASGRFPVVTRRPAPSPVGGLVTALRAGVLPDVDVTDRSVVVLPTTDQAAPDLVLRVVTDSLPRVHGVDPDDVIVVTPRRRGVAGAVALDAVLTSRLGPRLGPRARCVHEAHAEGSRWTAAVVVLAAESAGVLSRALVATACSLASSYVCVVAAAGPVLRDAVRRTPVRHRNTRLTALLRAG